MSVIFMLLGFKIIIKQEHVGIKLKRSLMVKWQNVFQRSATSDIFFSFFFLNPNTHNSDPLQLSKPSLPPSEKCSSQTVGWQ